MRTANIGRRTAAGTITLAMATGLVAVLDGPAHAGGFAPVRVAETTDSDDSTPKIVTATCTQGSVFAAGARVVDGAGGVVLTSMVPDPNLNSVTVTAVARTGHTGDWALTALATCDTSSSPPVREAAVVQSGSTAEVSCVGGARLVGTGFRVEGPVDHTYVDEVAFGPELATARVHTGGAAEPEQLTAFGICKQPTGPSGVRVQAATGHDSAWPKSAVTDGHGPDHHVYAVGAAVTGPGEFFLSALVPGPNLHLAGAEAAQASPLPGAGTLRADGGEDGDGSLTVTGLLMGAFH